MKITTHTLMIAAVAALAGCMLSSCGDKKKEAREALIREGVIKNELEVTGRQGKAALLKACKGGDVALLKKLLEAGAKPNTTYGEGKTPLVETVYWGYVEQTKLLIDAGADVNHTSHNGLNIMKHTIFGGDRVEIARMLLAAGAVVTDGELQYAKWHHRNGIIKLLTEHLEKK